MLLNWRRGRLPSNSGPRSRSPRRFFRPRIEELETRLLLSVTGDRTVARLYEDLLQRPLDGSGRASWGGMLDQGASAVQVVAGIERSPEYQGNQVQGLYGTLLRRPAEAAAANGWLQFLVSGGSLAQVRTAILGSPEYVRNRGGGTPDGFLASLFQDVLGRPLDPSAQRTFTDALASGSSPTAVADVVWHSPESTRVLVRNSYLQILDRIPDEAGFNSWVGALLGGLSEEAVVATFAGSAEYFERFISAQPPTQIDQPAVTVPGKPGQRVTTTFTLASQESAFANELGVFRVDDASGRIGDLHPGEPGYAAAALAGNRRLVTFTTSQAPGTVSSLDLDGGSFLGMFLIQNANAATLLASNPTNRLESRPFAFFASLGANPDRFEHVHALAGGRYAFEDLFAGGDRDFNDRVIQIQFATPTSNDTTPPAPPVFDLGAASDSAPLGDQQTTVSPVNLVGQTESGATVVLQETGATTTADAAGRFVFPGVPLVTGGNPFTARAQDAAGNAATFTRTIIRLVGPPEEILREGSAFRVASTRQVTIPADASVLRFTFAEAFDTSAVGTINDAFEAALLDSAGHTLVHVVGPDTDAFFNLTEGQPASLGAGVTLDGRTVTLNLAGLPAGMTASLVFRLVNNDGDTGTAVSLFSVTTAAGGSGVPVSAVPANAAKILDRPTIDFGGLADVSASLAPDYLQTTFHDDADVLSADLFLRNRGSYSVDAPLVVAVANLSDPSVRVRGADGVTPDGLPYFDLSRAVGAGGLAPGQATAPVRLEFFNPGRTPFTHNLVVLGRLNRAPLFTSTPDEEVLADKPYNYDIAATDADGDPLTFVLVTSPPTMTFDASTNRISWIPGRTDVGTHAVTVRVEDGRGGSAVQTYVVTVDADVPNRPPVFTSAPVVDGNVHTPYRYQTVANDRDDDPLTYALNAAPSGMAIDGQGQITWTPTGSQVGVSSVTVSVDDGRGGTAEQSFAIRVRQEAGNHAPVIFSEPVTAFVPSLPHSKIVVANDDWTFTDSGFSSGGNSTQFARNVATFFSGGRAGSFLVYSNNFGLNGTALANTMRGLGHTWTVSTGLPFTRATLQQFNGVFLGGFAVDNNVLIDYVNSGGNVYLCGGTGVFGSAASEAATWNSFLNAFGLAMDGSRFNAIRGNIGVSGHPLFDGVSTLFQDNGNDLLDLIPTDLRGQIASQGAMGEGLYAVYDRFVEEAAYRYDVDAIDPDDDALTYTLTTRPDGGMTIDPATGLIRWTPPKEFLTGDQVQFFDGTFDPADWETTRFNYDPNRPTSGSSTVTQVVTGGNPGAFRQIDFTLFDASNSTVTPAMLEFYRRAGATYDPRVQGAIFSIDYAEDTFRSTFLDKSNGMALRQNGRVYVAGILSSTPQNQWFHNPRAGLAETDFTAEDQIFRVITEPRAHPDFSATGALIEFGFFRANSNPPGGPGYTSGNGIDNWSVTVTPVNAADVSVQVSDTRGGVDTQVFTIETTRPSRVRGTVFDDRDGNGRWDRGADALIARGPQLHRIAADTRALLDADEKEGVSLSDMVFGPDGKIYVTSGADGSISRFDPNTGAFLDRFVSFGELRVPGGLTFGPDGNLYVADRLRDSVLRFNGTTGVFLDVFVTSNSGGMDDPVDLVFGPDANLYVVCPGTNAVLRYDGGTVAFIENFAASSQLFNPDDLAFGPDGNLYVSANTSGNVVRFNGTSGAFFDIFVPAGSGGLNFPQRITFGPDGNLYVSDRTQVLRYNGSSREFLDTYLPPQPGLSAGTILFTPGAANPELGLPSRIVYLDQNRNGRRDPSERFTTTDVNGQYDFLDLAPGNYRVAIERVADLFVTVPDLQAYDVTVAPTETLYRLDFGSAQGTGGIDQNVSPTFVSQPPSATNLDDVFIYVARASDPNADPLTFAVAVGPEGLAVDPFSGVVVWIPQSNQAGTHDVILRVEDGRGGVDLQAFTLAVALPNTAPVITSSPGGPPSVGRPFAYQVRAQDAEGDAITFRLAVAPTGMIVNTLTGLLTWTPAADQAGPALVTVVATDARGLEDRQTFDLAAIAAGGNAAPVIASAPPLFTALSSHYVYAVQATDAEGDRLTFGLTTGPVGMTIDPVTGLLVWTPTTNQLGPNQLVVTVKDGRGGAATQAFVVNVLRGPGNRAPVIISEPVRAYAPAEAGVAGREPYRYDVDAIDPEDDPVTYTLAAFPEGMTIDPASGLIEWVPPEEFLTAGRVTFNDGTFDPADWQTQTFTTDTSGQVNFDQPSDGGNPGSFRRLFSSVHGSSASDKTPAVLQAHLRQDAVYEPRRQGALFSVDFAADMNIFGGNGTQLGLVVRQDGKVYVGPSAFLAEGTPPGWNHKAIEGSTETRFTLLIDDPNRASMFDGTQHPDFSANGTPIEFGFWVFGTTATGLGGAGSLTGIDNWSVTVSSTPATSVVVRVEDTNGGVDTQAFTLEVTRPARLQGYSFNDLDGDGVWDRRNDLIIQAGARWQFDAATGGLVSISPGGGNSPILGPDSALYFNTGSGNTVLRVDPASGLTSVFASGSHLSVPLPMAFGPDGNLYVGNVGTNNVVRFDGATGAFLDVFLPTGRVSFPYAMTFGPDGNLYVANHFSSVVGFDGKTGAPLGFSAGNPTFINGITFGPDGNLYLSSDLGRNVRRYNGQTGAHIDEFVTRGSGGLDFAEGLAFGPDGNLYVASPSVYKVFRYNGTTGAFIDVFASFDLAHEPLRLLFVPRSADPQEPGLAGRVVFLDENRNGRRDPLERSAVTDANGLFVFDGLAPGVYRVAQERVPGFAPTAPALQAYDLTVVADQDVFQLDFGSVERSGGDENLPPDFFTTPPIVATVDVPLIYRARALDPNGDPLTFSLTTAPDGMTIDPLSGVVVWVLQLGQTGIHDVVLRVEDGRGGVDLQSFQLAVDPPNTAPVITSKQDGPAVVGRAFHYHAVAQDAEGDAITFRLVVAPAGMTIDPVTGLVTWTPAANQAGPQDVVVAAADARGLEAIQPFTLQVLAEGENTAPVISSLPRTTTGLAHAYLYQVRAADADGDPLEVTLSTAAAGMTLDPSSGLILWLPTASQFGLNAVTIRVTDGRGGEAEQSFTVNVVSGAVNQPPRIVSQPPLFATSDRRYAYNPVAVDPDHDVVVWGLDVAPAGMSIDPETGTIRWTPTDDQNGMQVVTVRVTDALGGSATQNFAVQVRGTNTPPLIISAPPTRTGLGREYTYAARAVDVDGDRLNFSLTQAPAGMAIDGATGAIRWTPAATQLGSHVITLRVEDGNGGSAQQRFTVLVAAIFNLPPEITSTPSTLASAGNQYEYAVIARDPEAGVLSYSIVTPPAGMAVTATGLITWIPLATQLGAQDITVRVTDDAGDTATQTFTITVREANAFPVLNGPPLQTVLAGELYRFDIPASDPDGDSLSFHLDTGPAGMTVDGAGRITWQTTLADAGLHDVLITIADNRGAEIELAYGIRVSSDTQAPRVAVSANPNPASLGSRVIIQALATDDTGIATLTLTVGGVAVALDRNGRATVPANTPGLFDIVTTATDLAGNTTSATRTLQVIDPSDVAAPVVELTSPQDDATITTFTDVVGTVNDDNLVLYTLAVAPVDSDKFVEIARGTTPIINGVLGRFDPTLLENDSYVLRLTGVDGGGNVSIVQHTVSITGKLKLGNFRLSFDDLSVPVAGIPITVTRTYDTLTADTQDDLGFGWRLDVRDTELRTSVKKTGAEEDGIFNPFRDGTRITIKLPDGSRQGFTFAPRLRFALFGLALFQPRFEPDPGVTSELNVAQFDMTASRTGEYFGLSVGGLPYNPADSAFGGTYTLRTREGVFYQIDGLSGSLRQATDREGNTLTFGPDGVLSSTGLRVTFGRDAQGRITSVTDPLGQTLRYRYDARGDLAAVTDRSGNVSRYEYSSSRPHYLERVIGPLGQTGTRTEYDEQGRLAALVDAAGNAVRLEHDLAHSAEIYTDPLGNRTTHLADERGNIVTEINALGGFIRRTFDADDNILTVTDPLNRTVTRTYDSDANLLSESDPLGQVTRFTYNEFGDQISTTDPLGQTTITTYDRAGNPTSITGGDGNRLSLRAGGSSFALGQAEELTDPSGARVIYDFDFRGRLGRIVDALGHETRLSVDEDGREGFRSQRVTTPTGERTLLTERTFDAEGRLLTVRDAEGQISRFEYDALGQLTATVDPLGRRTDYSYDQVGNQVAVHYQDGTSDLFAYDAAHRRIAATDRAGRTTRYEYDPLDQLLATILPDQTPESLTDNPRLRTEYDAAGQLLAEIDPRGNRTEYTYDAAGHRILRRDAMGNETHYAYDALGRLTAEVDPLGHTTRYEYNARSLQTHTISADGTSTQTEYDAVGRPVTRTDQEGRATQFAYDAEGHLIAIIDAVGARTEYTYDEIGRRIAQIDANGNITRYEYDGVGRQTAQVRPLSQRATNVYDAGGNIISTTDANGNTIALTYDSNNRLARKQLSDGNAIEYSYTPNGSIATVTDARGTTRFEYDSRDHPLLVVEPDGRAIRYAYDDAGNVISIAGLTGTTRYTFDALNRLSTVTSAEGGTTSYFYDPAGNLIRTTFANGVIETRDYDALNQLNFLEDVGTNGVVASFQYTLSAAGVRTAVSENTGRKSKYAYDAAYRLVMELISDPVSGNRSAAYAYDPVGNRLSREDSAEGRITYDYDANDRLLAETLNGVVTRYTYDANGNTLSQNKNAIDQFFYAWDAENRLVSVDSNGDGTGDIAYRYDANGIRVARIVNGSETRYLVDENRDYPEVLEEYQPDGTAVVSYVHGRDLISQQRSGAQAFYQADGLGSTRLLTDALSVVTDRYTYDAYGQMLGQTGSTANDYLFAGEQFDSDVKSYYLRARYYQPEQGRFLSTDPAVGSVLAPETLHRYQYANANPVNLVDPSGTTAVNLADTAIANSIQNELRQQEVQQQSANITFRILPRIGRAMAQNMVRTVAQLEKQVGTNQVRDLCERVIRDGIQGIRPGLRKAVLGAIRQFANQLGREGNELGSPLLNAVLRVIEAPTAAGPSILFF